MSYVNRLAVSVPEAAEALGGVSENTIWNLLRDNRLRRVKVGRRTLVPVSSLEEFVSGISEGDRLEQFAEGMERPSDEPTS